ncbi:hypothetical protein [uncultured Acinetobacter sp.]|uniref:hypothetical protein n=1 Tax=uncultured Acinetobacter sp. TaxID=165433 RepID=UPI002639A27E|nr:hypothetical protein [uncultured Acinetobacter sp.]
MRFKKPTNRIAPAVIAGVTIGLLVAGYKFVFANKKPKLERQDREKAQQEQENQKDREQAIKEEQQHEDKKAEEKQAAEADQQPK